VQEALHKQELPPLLPWHRVEHVLIDPCIRTLQASPHSDRRLVCELDAHLQQADGEEGVRLGCDPEAETLVDLLRLQQKLLQLTKVPEPQVSVLQ
jgi:hypothetical protein